MQQSETGGMLRVSALDRRSLELGWWPLLRNKAHELVVKARGHKIHGQGMIGAAPEAVRDGFASLSDEAFSEYNFPQRWVERRTIPVAIDGRVPARDAIVLDLGCGPGTSTEVLAHFADESWRIIGYDLTPRSIERARARASRGGFVNRFGRPVRPEFHCQDIGGTLRRDGEALPSSFADLAVSGGVVGLYMNPRSVWRLAAELRRVLKPGGYAALDAGPAVPARALREIMTRAGFEFVLACRSVVFDPRPKLVFRLRAEASPQALGVKEDPRRGVLEGMLGVPAAVPVTQAARRGPSDT